MGDWPAPYQAGGNSIFGDLMAFSEQNNRRKQQAKGDAYMQSHPYNGATDVAGLNAALQATQGRGIESSATYQGTMGDQIRDGLARSARVESQLGQTPESAAYQDEQRKMGQTDTQLANQSTQAGREIELGQQRVDQSERQVKMLEETHPFTLSGMQENQKLTGAQRADIEEGTKQRGQVSPDKKAELKAKEKTSVDGILSDPMSYTMDADGKPGLTATARQQILNSGEYGQQVQAGVASDEKNSLVSGLSTAIKALGGKWPKDIPYNPALAPEDINKAYEQAGYTQLESMPESSTAKTKTSSGGSVLNQILAPAEAIGDSGLQFLAAIPGAKMVAPDFTNAYRQKSSEVNDNLMKIVPIIKSLGDPRARAAINKYLSDLGPKWSDL